MEDQPTPVPTERTSLIERMMVRPWLLIGLVLAGLLVVVFSGALLWLGLGRDQSLSILPDFVTPPSLEELSATYPELSGLLGDPAIGSVYKDFMIAYQEGGLLAAEKLARQRGLLNDRDEIRITLVVDREENVPRIIAELGGAGITVEGSYRDRVNVGVPLALIQQMGDQQGTRALFQQLTQMEHIIRLELPSYNRSNADGDTQGEGVALTGAGAWHDAGVTGQSMRIGVLDLGFDGYRDLLGDELPETVTVASFVYGVEPDQTGVPHGTACAEVVHAMAPDAELFLAYYDGSLVSEGMAVEWLQEQGVDIISHSATGIVGPMDGSDEAAELVDDAAGQGILWVNSSGNSAVEHHRGQFNDSDGNGFHEFASGSEALALWVYKPEVVLALNWDDWRDVSEDYDLYLYDQWGELVASAQNTQDGSPGQVSAEFLMVNDLPEGAYSLSIKAHRTTRDGILDLFTQGAELDQPTALHSLCSPADARGALAVGATEVRDDSLALYSSQGPANDGRIKPEISAPTGVTNATYGAYGFEGTSAAAPHVAGAAALVWSAFPDWSHDQVRDYLLANALDLGPAGPDNAYGYGRLRMPAPAGGTSGLSPTPAAPLVTLAPVATEIASVIDPVDSGGEETGMGFVPALILGASGLCGTAVVVGGGALLLAALLRSGRRSAVEAGHHPATYDSPAQLFLRPVSGDFEQVCLNEGVTTIGRSPSNDIVLDSRHVGRHHVRVEVSHGACHIQDLGSANGTLVNGLRVTRVALAEGDRLRMGDVEVVVGSLPSSSGAALLPRGAATPGAGQAWIGIDGQCHPLLDTGALIGRSTTSDIHLPDPTVSRQHARIDARDEGYMLTDLDSSCGTYVNDKRIQELRLAEGDEIRIGQKTLWFHAGGTA